MRFVVQLDAFFNAPLLHPPFTPCEPCEPLHNDATIPTNERRKLQTTPHESGGCAGFAACGYIFASNISIINEQDREEEGLRVRRNRRARKARKGRLIDWWSSCAPKPATRRSGRCWEIIRIITDLNERCGGRMFMKHFKRVIGRDR